VPIPDDVDDADDDDDSDWGDDDDNPDDDLDVAPIDDQIAGVDSEADVEPGEFDGLEQDVDFDNEVAPEI
jgi:hypothetical protein